MENGTVSECKNVISMNFKYIFLEIIIIFLYTVHFGVM